MNRAPVTPALHHAPNLGAPSPRTYTLGVAELLATGGTFPLREGGPAANTLGMVHSLAGGNYPAFGAPACSGQILPLAQNQPLFSLLGTTYGGNGMTDFALPDLRGRTPVGNEPNLEPPVQSVPLTYMVAADAPAGSAFPMIGAIGLFACNFAPAGWMVADGSLLPISQNVPLFEAIGKTFGGDGASSFALPDLRNRAVVGAGQNMWIDVTLGETLDPSANGGIGGLGLNYIVSVSGAFPPSQGDGGFPDGISVLGEVIANAGGAIPAGWLPTNGQLLAIADYEALFQLVGTTYGGDGEESFALPNLQGQMIAGLSQ
jgi:microcystin-dependent protein